ncbi:hypothetical protein HDV00_010919 [Rhizophlyctis rosea]|nr:hypothetical protein HDV00_010919 [Rhizophlyctis rosea]
MNLLVVAAIVAPLFFFWSRVGPFLATSGGARALPGGINGGNAKKKKAKKNKKATSAVPEDPSQKDVPPSVLVTGDLRPKEAREKATEAPSSSTPAGEDSKRPARAPKLSQKQKKKQLRQQRADEPEEHESPNLEEERPAKEDTPSPVLSSRTAARVDHGMDTDSDDDKREPARVLRVRGDQEDTLSSTEVEESDGWQVVDVQSKKPAKPATLRIVSSTSTPPSPSRQSSASSSQTSSLTKTQRQNQRKAAAAKAAKQAAEDEQRARLQAHRRAQEQEWLEKARKEEAAKVRSRLLAKGSGQQERAKQATVKKGGDSWAADSAPGIWD